MTPLRLFLYEYYSAQPGQKASEPLRQAGTAMLQALVTAFACQPGVELVTMAAHPAQAPPEALCRNLPPGSDEPQLAFERALDACQAVLIVAPESGGCLLRLTQCAEARGKLVLGCSSQAIAQSSDKYGCLLRWRQQGLPTAASVLLAAGETLPEPCGLGWPRVVKPNCGAGGLGIRLWRHGEAPPRTAEPLLIQEYLPGEPISLSCLVEAGQVQLISLNRQRLAADGFACGQVIPLAWQPRQQELLSLAQEACAALPGLRGFVGLDLLRHADRFCLLECNARLTLAFAALPAARRSQIAARLLARLPTDRRLTTHSHERGA